MIAGSVLTEIAVEKIRSFLQRSQPRDLYDLWKIFSDPPAHLNPGNVLEHCLEKFVAKVQGSRDLTPF